MRQLGPSGVWELFVPGVGAGTGYKFVILGADGEWRREGRPDGLPAPRRRRPPSSVVYESTYDVGRRRVDGGARRPAAVARARCRSTRCTSARGGSGTAADLRPARRRAGRLRRRPRLHPRRAPAGVRAPVRRLVGLPGHVLLRPRPRASATPTTSAASSTGCTRRGIGVIVDWVPAHFPKDDVGAGPLRRHRRCTSTPTRAAAEHPDWGTLRLQLRPQRGAQLPGGQRAVLARGVPHRRAAGRRGRLDALPRLLAQRGRVDPEQSTAAARTSRPCSSCRRSTPPSTSGCPGATTIAEESTSWPGVTRADRPRRPGLRPQVEHGLDARHARLPRARAGAPRVPPRRADLRLIYAFSENFVLPLSPRRGRARQGLPAAQDARRPLAAARQPARLPRRTCGPIRASSCCSWAGEFGQESEWAEGARAGLVAARPRRAPRRPPAGAGPQPGLHATPPRSGRATTSPPAFEWIDANDAGQQRVLLPALRTPATAPLACVANFAAVPHDGYRLGLPSPGAWDEVAQHRRRVYTGSGVGNLGIVDGRRGRGERPAGSATLVLPPLATVWLRQD